jgi:hypothetical protein
VVTGASVQVAMAANGYLDQLVVEVVLVGAAAAALRAAGGGPGRAVGAICLAGAWIVHWQFAAAFTALLVLVAVLTLPASVGRRRDPGGFAGTPAGRLAATLAGSAAGALALLATVPTPPRLPIGLGRSAIDRHLAKQVELYELPATGGAAAVGAALLGTAAGREGRLAATILVPWALAPAAAAIAYDAGLVVPVQRAISAAVAIPILGGLALATIVALVGRRGGRVAAALVALVLTAPVAGSAWLGWEAWRSRSPWSEDPRLAEFRALAAYLTAAGRPAIVVVDRAEPPTGDGALRHFGTVPVLRRLRAELPAALAIDTRVYLGDPDRLLAGQPTLRPGEPGFDEVSRETWSAVRPLLARDPLVVVPRSQFARFAAEVADHRRWIATPWLAIVEGPPPPRGFDRPPSPRLPSASTLAESWATTILAVAVAGAGWAITLSGGPIVLRLAMAPALGVALLVLTALAAERLGIRAGVGVWATVAATGAAAGWLGARPRGDATAPAAPDGPTTGGSGR